MIDSLLSERADLHLDRARIADLRAELAGFGDADTRQFDGEPAAASVTLERALSSAREANTQIADAAQRLEAQEAEIARLEAQRRNVMIGVGIAIAVIVLILILVVAL